VEAEFGAGSIGEHDASVEAGGERNGSGGHLLDWLLIGRVPDVLPAELFEFATKPYQSAN